MTVQPPEPSSCMACRFVADPSSVPGGRIADTTHWVVEHCVGPLGVGTLILKPRRHVVAVASLTDAEVGELGPLLRKCSMVAQEVSDADQVYNTLWSHANARPGHVHYVIQPVTAQQCLSTGLFGPALQMAMFDADAVPDPGQVAVVAERARALWNAVR